MNHRIILLAAFLLLTGKAIHAQQRKCDLEISLLSPSEGAVIPAFAQYNLTVRVLNNGPNDLLLGDTLWYNIPTMSLISYATYILQAPINSGTSKDITLATLANVNENTEDETVNYYVIVRSSPDTAGGVYRDMSLIDNVDSNHVTFKPCGTNGGGTAIHNVSAKDLNINIYPNPATNEIGIKMEGLTANRILVADLSGRIVFSTKMMKQTDHKLDISSLTPGMYFLKIETEKGIASAKFIKQ